MALPERRVRVILSVLEAMGVAEEVKAARWKGVEPKPTREQIDKAASVFEARRISDRRRLDSLLKYMNTQKCRVQMLRAYFGEPEGEKCGLCDSDAGLDSEVFDPGSADERHGLHAATDFHARPRRRRRGRGGGHEAPAGMPAHAQAQAAPPPPKFEWEIPGDVPAPLPPYEVPPPPDSEQAFDEGLWAAADAGVGEPLAGDAVIDMNDPELAQTPAAAADEGAPAEEDFGPAWVAVRDANIRPYAEWRPGGPVTLPVLAARPPSGGGQASHAGHHGHGHGGGGGGNHRGGGPDGRFDGGGGGGGGGRRRRRRGRNRDGGGGDRNRRDHHRHRDRDRGPRLPGVYNPGGD